MVKYGEVLRNCHGHCHQIYKLVGGLMNNGMIDGIPMGCLPYKHPVPYFWPYFARDIPLHRPEK
jgi:hypothetical protein